MLLVGNKADCVQRKVVDYWEAKELATELGMGFMEASAKSSTNVENAFMGIAENILNGKGLQANNCTVDKKVLTAGRQKTKKKSFGCILL
mmetsp:Transcript_8268/g.34730  ORF Transcript_8268/g.34730 Transcript_8268/m.34730 type:complete len:90 (-) Transcript_8268:45-314(-)